MRKVPLYIELGSDMHPTPSAESQNTTARRRTTSAEIKQLRTKIEEVKAARLIAAREMNGMTQVEAAACFGYQKSTQLSLIESGRRRAPEWFMARASDVYSVSLDYLYGVSEECERDPAGAMLRWIRKGVEGQTAAIVQSLTEVGLVYARSMSPLIGPAFDVAEKSENVLRAIERVRELNPEWQDMRGGATLEEASRQLSASAKQLKQEAVRRVNFAAEPVHKLRAVRSEQLSLLESLSEPLSLTNLAHAA
jgi:transcriptional regulator with XRE-family HTH domain